MKIYSEITKEFYDSVTECEKAEEEISNKKQKEKEYREKLLAERKTRADEVEAARKKMVSAQEEYQELIKKFIRDYKSYHYSTCNVDDIPKLLSYFWGDIL